jgi:hypothetical protein
MRLLLAFLLLLPLGSLHAHGGVSMEDDTCGKAIIVVDFIDPALRTHTVAFRVLRDTNDLGQRARHEDLGDARAIDDATLFKRDPQVYSKGTLTFEQTFDTPGWFIGMLSATDPANGQTLHSVFPFQVGVVHPWRYMPVFLLVTALSLLIYRLTGRTLTPAQAKNVES